MLSTHELETDTFVPSEANQIPVTGGGPTGLALDARGGLLYVLTRFDNAISVVDVRGRHEIAHVPMFNPEPASVVKGRPFLYDATLTSSHGDSACASCHIFGDFDSLAWDLGDPGRHRRRRSRGRSRSISRWSRRSSAPARSTTIR